jgi:hypothetical protein
MIGVKMALAYWRCSTDIPNSSMAFPVLKGNFAKKIFFYMFFLMYKYGCLYVY